MDWEDNGQVHFNIDEKSHTSLVHTDSWFYGMQIYVSSIIYRLVLLLIVQCFDISLISKTNDTKLTIEDDNEYRVTLKFDKTIT